jgi:hypothetical protein
VDTKLIESLFPFDWMGWKIQGYAHHSPSYLTGAGVFLWVFRLCYLFIYGLFNKTVMVLIQCADDISTSFFAEVRKVLSTRG